MLLRATFPDEHPEQPFVRDGKWYYHAEHARWDALWRELGLSADYLPEKNVELPIGNYDRRRNDPFSQKKATCLYYAPHFYVKELDRFVDIRRGKLCQDSQLAAVRFYKRMGIPVVMFEEMFHPTEERLSPRAHFFREVRAPFPYFLLYGQRICIGPIHNNHHHALHPKLISAFREAMKVR